MQNHVVLSTLLEDHHDDLLRSGEGDMVVLSDGRILFLYTNFDAPWDAAHARIVRRYSEDGGLTWSDAETVVETPPGSQNVMAASLAMLPDGRVGCVYIHRRESKTDCRPHFMASDDVALTWSEPVPMAERPGFYNAENGRFICLASGRLAATYSYRAPGARERDDAIGGPLNGCCLSDDGGRTWRLSAEVRTTAATFTLPDGVDFDDEGKPLAERTLNGHEPGIVELADGRVMMHVRTGSGFVGRAYSEDGCETWSDLRPIAELRSPMSNQKVCYLPDSERLVMIYNDRHGAEFGSVRFGRRTPVGVAVSDDHGATWRRHGTLMPEDGRFYCYFSLIFTRGRAVISCYESVPVDPEDVHWGRCDEIEGQRRLASLRLLVVENEWFRGPSYHA